MSRHIPSVPTRRSIFFLAILLAFYYVFYNYEYISLTSINYLALFAQNDSISQLFSYFPHEIDCDRIFAGDKDYTKSIALHRPKLDNDSLDMSCEAIQARFASAPSYYESYPIAYAKTVYKDYQFLEQQMWNTYTLQNWYCFSIDLKVPQQFRTKISQLATCLPNVLIANVSRKVGSNGVNQNYAHLDCMKTLKSRKFEYVFLLQNHDILTRTHKEFSEILTALEGSAVVDRLKCPSNRCLKSYLTNLGKLGMCPKSWKGEKQSACQAASITYMKGGMQALLPKTASDYIVNEINGTAFIDMYSKNFAGDEQFFPSLMTTEPLKIPGRYSVTTCSGYPRMLRHVIWFKVSKCGSRNMRHGVCVFGLEDLPELKNVQPFIINKMLPSFDNGAIQCYNELLLKRSLGNEPSYDDIDSFANGDYARFQRELRQPGFDPTKFVCNRDRNKTTAAVTPTTIATKTSRPTSSVSYGFNLQKPHDRISKGLQTTRGEEKGKVNALHFRPVCLHITHSQVCSFIVILPFMSLPTTILSCFIAFLSLAECRVKFTHSSIYDEYDFIGQTRAKCSSVKQCAIFVSILSDAKYEDIYRNIQMAPEVRTWNFTLEQFAGMRNTTTREIQPYFITDGATVPSSTTYIWNDNKEKIAAPLVIYAVNLDNELNYDHTTGVFDAADIADGVVRGQIVTILSAKPFTTTISGDKDTIATIFATGFDNADVNDKNPDKCRRVMQTSFDEMVSFQINGPITSIYFSDFKGNLVDSKNSINTALTYVYDHLVIEPRGFVTSQGFIGCESGQIYRSSLYGDLVQYSLFAPDSHFVYQAVYVKTDDERPVNVHTDNSMKNYLGNDLLTPQQDCFETHMLQVNFNQTQTNSFSFVYSYSNMDCDGKILTTSAGGIKTTTTTTTKMKTQPISDASGISTIPTTGDSTTSSSVGIGTLSLLAAVLYHILMVESPTNDGKIDEFIERGGTSIFLGFPDEIIEMIFDKLDFIDLCNVRGVNKRFYRIEGKVKKPLLKRKNLMISGENRLSPLLTVVIGLHGEKVSLGQAVLLIRRLVNIFNFESVVFAPSQKEHIELINELSEITTNLFRIPAWFGEYDANHLSTHFDRSVICNLMRNIDIVKILRVCSRVKPEDLLHVYETARDSASFCGIALRIPRKTARDFVKNILGEEGKMKGTSWEVERTEGPIAMVVERRYLNCGGSGYKFSIYNSGCEEKYPMLRSNDLYEESEVMGNLLWFRSKDSEENDQFDVKSDIVEMVVETSFLDHPDELIENILSRVDFIDRCRMRGVNKRLYGIEERMKKPLENRPNLIISDYGSFTDIQVGIYSDEFCVSTAALLLKRFQLIFQFKKIKLIDRSVHSPMVTRSIVCDILRGREIVKITRVCPLLTSLDLEHIIQAAKVSDQFWGIGIRVSEEAANEFMKTCNTQDEFRIGHHYKVEREEGSLRVGMYCDYDEYTFVAYKVPSKFEKILDELMISPTEIADRGYHVACRDASDYDVYSN
ncbi:hypothetical protein PRIPAC_84057 [Pristionchus pacificus]|uniref:F-box domain-containing protein n=1 Tax=Pristionchus pacificus TaxID=54126 RepID=A0A2A6BH06_PRIPA|nr:hypothetical protein PRIPAC_84057 [Pristionchus pacificus]|eukprot:PDM65133.1 F-box domain-containing protein [Pristionchus pacificus]